MSAETIDGLAVVSREPAKHLAHTDKLELEDGSVRFVCIEGDCTYLMTNVGQARGHRKKHTLSLGGALKDVTVGTLVEAYKAYQESPQEETASQEMADRLVAMQEKHREDRAKIRAQEKAKRQKLTEQNRELRKENKKLRTIVENIQKAAIAFDLPSHDADPSPRETGRTKEEPEVGEGLTFRESIKT